MHHLAYLMEGYLQGLETKVNLVVGIQAGQKEEKTWGWGGGWELTGE